ncbi:unnamed protein product [Larinioides sclopetarius]|uniref:Uncharacterized protein n=1 Tax=Larinioides sclopetarius TaxID=280406 RepID=A0AAV2AYC1_9ARAC
MSQILYMPFCSSKMTRGILQIDTQWLL